MPRNVLDMSVMYVKLFLPRQAKLYCGAACLIFHCHPLGSAASGKMRNNSNIDIAFLSDINLSENKTPCNQGASILFKFKFSVNGGNETLISNAPRLI